MSEKTHMYEDYSKTRAVDLVRKLPEWAKVDRYINELPIYNMNIFENIMSWNQYNLDVPALDYYGTQITYGELPDRVNEYICGFKQLGIKEGDVVTICLPVSIENVLTVFALDIMGAIANNVNYLFLKSDFDEYTRQKKSNVLITADVYLPFFVDSLEESKMKKVILMNLKDYLTEENAHVFDDLSSLPPRMRKLYDNPELWAKTYKKATKIKTVKFYRIPEVIKLGKKHLEPMKSGPCDLDRDVSYSYTSGTTGKPKCIVYKEASAHAVIEMHIGIDTRDRIGYRVFQVIPLTHATGERMGVYFALARAKTLVLFPLYNKDSFAEDIMKYNCNWIVAAASFYLAGLAGGILGPNALAGVTNPASGGEPITKSNIAAINKWLRANGCKRGLIMAGGASEDGAGTLFPYYLDEEKKTNETGHPIAPYIKVKIVDENGKPVKKGERGFYEVSSPGAADRYLNNPEASAKRWYYDEDGIRWGATGDIAVQSPENDSITLLGRAEDSYVDENGEKHFLFDIEYQLDINDPIIEWEISAHKIEKGYAVVGQIVLKKEEMKNKAEIVGKICKKYGLDAVKFYDRFENSDVTGKRDFKILKADKSGYYAPLDSEHLQLVDFVNDKWNVREVVTIDSL